MKTLLKERIAHANLILAQKKKCKFTPNRNISHPQRSVGVLKATTLTLFKNLPNHSKDTKASPRSKVSLIYAVP
jgi:hypothetical protein